MANRETPVLLAKAALGAVPFDEKRTVEAPKVLYLHQFIHKLESFTSFG